MSIVQHEGSAPIALTSNFHAGQTDVKTNFHAGESFHVGSLRKEGESGKLSNFHAGNFHIGELNPHATENFHAGNFHAVSAESTREAADQESKSEAGNFDAGDRDIDLNFHRGAILHVGNFHAGDKTEGNNFHAGDRTMDPNFHAGAMLPAGNFHAVDAFKTPNILVGLNAKQNFHAGCSKHLSKVDNVVSDIINFHAGQQPLGLAGGRGNTRSQRPTKVKGFETKLSFYASTFDGKPGFNYVEKPTNGIYSNVTTSSHQLLVTDIRGSEDQVNLDRDAVLTVSNIPDHGCTFTDDASVINDFYPQVEQLLLQHVPGAQRVFIFDHTIRRKFGDRGPVLRAHIDQTPASALARITRHLPDEATCLSKCRVRLINLWRPINGTVENYPLAFALSGSVPDTKLESVKHHYPTWTGETYGVGYSEGQNWCYWSKMGNSDALLLQCFDSEKGGRLAHSAVVDPTSTSQKYRESIEVRALVFG
ncbi:hypothetical protein BGZ57DRAFT_828585 [Hyaloscypha finlandica]|nr:hypothetical protein BGZ57DRAFT_828585 [Hyaloscypha finlandica]